eukprot:366546-Chlamydomonas_euryale.AAC.10
MSTWHAGLLADMCRSRLHTPGMIAGCVLCMECVTRRHMPASMLIFNSNLRTYQVLQNALPVVESTAGFVTAVHPDCRHASMHLESHDHACKRLIL